MLVSANFDAFPTWVMSVGEAAGASTAPIAGAGDKPISQGEHPPQMIYPAVGERAVSRMKSVVQIYVSVVAKTGRPKQAGPTATGLDRRKLVLGPLAVAVRTPGPGHGRRRRTA